jgi:hypothetical protein
MAAGFEPGEKRGCGLLMLLLLLILTVMPMAGRMDG